MDNWSVKDILAHVTTWEEEALKYLPLILTGGKPPRYIRYGGIDAFNAQMAEQKRGLSLSGVQRQLNETHRRLLDYLQSVPEEHIARETRFRRRLRLDTYSHYPEHARAIREWREREVDYDGPDVDGCKTEVMISGDDFTAWIRRDFEVAGKRATRKIDLAQQAIHALWPKGIPKSLLSKQIEQKIATHLKEQGCSSISRDTILRAAGLKK